MVNYLKKFSPELADLSKPLRELIKKDGYPVTYTARSLTATEVSYTQIEKKNCFQLPSALRGLRAISMEERSLFKLITNPWSLLCLRVC